MTVTDHRSSKPCLLSNKSSKHCRTIVLVQLKHESMMVTLAEAMGAET